MNKHLKKHLSNIPTQHLLGLFALAIALRIMYLLIAVNHAGSLELLLSSLNDSIYYWRGADYVLGEYPGGAEIPLRIGPGFISLVAFFKLFTNSPLPIYICNILAGGLSTIFVYMIFHQLFESKFTALIAGLFHTLSPTAISLSANFLTDQLFFTLHTGSLYFLITGIKNSQTVDFALSGLLSAVAALIKSVNQFWWLILLIIGLFLPKTEYRISKKELIKRISLTVSIMLICILGWSARNYIKHDLFLFGTNGTLAANSYIASQVLTIADSTQTRESIYLKQKKETDSISIHSSNRLKTEYEQARIFVGDVFQNYPQLFLKMYFLNIYDNVKVGSYLPKLQIPYLKPVWNTLIKINGKWFGDVRLILVLLSLLLLLKQQKMLPFYILAGHYFYFTLITGVTFNQGSRIFYQAELAETILIVYLGWQVIKTIQNYHTSH